MHRRLNAALSALALIGALAGCGTSGPEPTPGRTSETSSQAARSHTATVKVTGGGVATDVTVSVIDPDTGLKPTQGAEGLEGGSATPTDSDQSVGDVQGQTDSNKNVPLPFTESYELTAGQKLTVAAQNGTSATTITVSVTLDGDTTVHSATGANVAVSATSREVR
ncbi:MAG: hypothetical protein ABF453_02825 [Bifidobacterium psychraerophilum]|uniref:hypothetical protein n=1 Tax=Bifidobacterium psychraerophilum TaxID=218140 RepID=UPI0039E96D9C